MDTNTDPAVFYQKGREYWHDMEANMSGMLGGYTCVNIYDVDESKQLLKKLFAETGLATSTKTKTCLDCGAGIGRVTKYVLSEFFDRIDLLEQSKRFLEVSKDYLKEKYSQVSHVYAQGIEEFQPLEGRTYDCIWGQWVFGNVTNEDFLQFLRKCAKILNSPHGFIVIKDNVSSYDEDFLHDEDLSVSRTVESFCNLINQVEELELKYVLKQKKYLNKLLPLQMFVMTLKK